jgi:hypothetical protein
MSKSTKRMNSYKSIVVYFIITLNCSVCMFSQAEEGLNVLSFELGGKGFAYSVNYERLFKWKKNPLWHSVSVGFTGFKVGNKEHVYFFPLSYNKLISKGEAHWFEMGIVMSPGVYTRVYKSPYGPIKYVSWALFPGVTVGYRRHIFKISSWFFKVNGYVFFSKYFPSGMIPSVGVTFGKAF